MSDFGKFKTRRVKHHGTRPVSAFVFGTSEDDDLPVPKITGSKTSPSNTLKSPGGSLRSKSPGNTLHRSPTNTLQKSQKSPNGTQRSPGGTLTKSPGNSLTRKSNSSSGDTESTFSLWMKSANKNSSGRKKSSISKHKTVDMSTFHKEDECEYDLLSLSRLSSTLDADSLLESLESLGPYNLLSNLPPLDMPESSETTLSHVVVDVAVRSDINKAGLQRGKKEKVEVLLPTGSKKKVYQMEDQNLCLCPFNDDTHQAFFGVFDGHVDKNAAIDAKELFPKEFTAELHYETQPIVNVTQTMRKTFKRVDEMMKIHQYEGSTGTVAYIWSQNGNRYLQVANVGDSSAFICRNGESVALTLDHKPSMPSEHQRLKDMGIEMHEGKTRLNGLAVSRSLGDHFAKDCGSGVIADPYISEPIKLLPTDTHLVIASDGLWDVISGKRCMEIIKNEANAGKMAEKLLNTALQSPKCKDNVTVIVVCL